MNNTIVDTRNVIDYYKYWRNDAIKADLEEKRHNFSVLISNKFYDFNIATVIRNSNAFLAANVFIYGRRQYDKRGTVGTHNYENIKKVKVIEDVHDLLNGLQNPYVIGIDNVESASPIETYTWDSDKHYILVFGQEDVGIPDELKELCHEFLYIKQYGCVRSLNVGTASGITMYAYASNVTKA